MAHPEMRQTRKRKRAKQDSVSLSRESAGDADIEPPAEPSTARSIETPMGPRDHSLSYHDPLLLSNPNSSAGLLTWFSSVSESRSMPWRKPWLDPNAFRGSRKQLHAAMMKRAYEVWVSEIMLQQTRVAVVIPYFNNWISKWPTVQDLAQADSEDILAAWKGLGYYSRATRLHEAAKLLTNDKIFNVEIPETAEELQKVPGIGRYTAGAISSIAFGRARPLLDGNVSRVLCRQLGLYGDVKKKKVTDFLWQAADALVKDVAEKHGGQEKSSIPGSWNQALMELGSTVCTTRPKCELCPVQTTCRAFAEGKTSIAQPSGGRIVADIEDVCGYCEPFEEQSPAGNVKEQKGAAVQSPYFSAGKPQKMEIRVRRNQSVSQDATGAAPDPLELDVIRAYCSKFPKKAVKEKVREEECVVCLIERKTDSGGTWLIEKRPPKGLLASLWQFPLITLSETNNSTVTKRKITAKEFTSSFDLGVNLRIKHKAELGAVTHCFSHLKLKMYVHLFAAALEEESEEVNQDLSKTRKWVDGPDVDEQNLWTGMMRCWELVKQ